MIVLVGILHLAVFPLLLLTENDRYGQEVTVLLQQTFEFVFLEEFLTIIGEMHDDVGTSILAAVVLECEFGTTVATPLDSLGAFLIALRDDVYTVAYHKRTVEAQTEMADDGVGILLVFVEEIVGSREGYLIDILINLLGRHADTAVADGNGASVLVHLHLYLQFTHLALEVAFTGEGLQFLCRIHGIRDNLADEDLVI